MTVKKKRICPGDVEIENELRYIHEVIIFVHVESVVFTRNKDHDGIAYKITPQIVIDNNMIRLCQNPVYEVDNENDIISHYISA